MFKMSLKQKIASALGVLGIFCVASSAMADDYPDGINQQPDEESPDQAVWTNCYMANALMGPVDLNGEDVGKGMGQDGSSEGYEIQVQDTTSAETTDAARRQSFTITYFKFEDTFRLYDNRTRHCMASKYNSNALTISDCDETDRNDGDDVEHYRWKFLDVGGWAVIVSWDDTSKAIGTQNSGSFGNKLTLADKDGGQDQKWFFSCKNDGDSIY